MAVTENYFRGFAPRKWTKPNGTPYSDRTYYRKAKKYNFALIPDGVGGPLIDPDDAEEQIKNYGLRLRQAREARKPGRQKREAAR
jgi:hypothetical protein